MIPISNFVNLPPSYNFNVLRKNWVFLLRIYYQHIYKKDKITFGSHVSINIGDKTVKCDDSDIYKIKEQLKTKKEQIIMIPLSTSNYKIQYKKHDNTLQGRTSRHALLFVISCKNSKCDGFILDPNGFSNLTRNQNETMSDMLNENIRHITCRKISYNHDLLSHTEARQYIKSQLSHLFQVNIIDIPFNNFNVTENEQMQTLDEKNGFKYTENDDSYYHGKCAFIAFMFGIEILKTNNNLTSQSLDKLQRDIYKYGKYSALIYLRAFSFHTLQFMAKNVAIQAEMYHANILSDILTLNDQLIRFDRIKQKSRYIVYIKPVTFCPPPPPPE